MRTAPRSAHGTAAQMRAGAVGKHHFDVLGGAAARGAVERLRDQTVADDDLALGLRHRAIGQRVLGVHPAVGLAPRRGADVEALGQEGAEPAHGVGPRRHRLRLERVEAVVELGPHLDRHHAAQIVLERELVDDVEQAAIVEVDQDAAAVATAIEPHARSAVGLDRDPAPRRLGLRSRLAAGNGERRVLETAALLDHPGAVDALIDQSMAEAVGRGAFREAAQPHPVERRRHVEAHLRRRSARSLERARDRARLLLVLERRDLQLVGGLLGLTAGRHFETGGDRSPRAAVLDPHRLAAGQHEALEIGLETDSDQNGAARRAVRRRQRTGADVGRSRRRWRRRRTRDRSPTPPARRCAVRLQTPC